MQCHISVFAVDGLSASTALSLGSILQAHLDQRSSSTISSLGATSSHATPRLLTSREAVPSIAARAHTHDQMRETLTSFAIGEPDQVSTVTISTGSAAVYQHQGVDDPPSLSSTGSAAESQLQEVEVDGQNQNDRNGGV
mgnify:FL=1